MPTIGDLVDKAITKEQDGDRWLLRLNGDLPFSMIQPMGGRMTLVSSESEGVININGNMAKQIIYGLMEEAFAMGRASLKTAETK